MQTGKIGVTTENIFPIIKKFLYSDHEIFLREVVSNAIDATQKLKALASAGEFSSELGDLTVRIFLDTEKKTLTISDAGIGMTKIEVEKYINQIAFSSAEDFLEKYKDKAEALIGHFGLGFYSAFMVSKKVEIFTKSYQNGAEAVKWSCDGSPEYQIETIEKEKRGTDVVLHLDDDSQEFAAEDRIEKLLKKYCKFLPVEIGFGKEKEWKDGKQLETDKDKIINNPKPAWTRKPSELNDEDYKNFYKELYPESFDEPLFNIHLNVDYPFNLTGILYFPRIKNNLEIQKNKIQLYCRQVFVTDSVEGIVPDFLMLLHGVLDSPDIPLNVSRSFLQSDSNVKKISSHITKKVADRLTEIFKNQRPDFEKKWDYLKLFIQYGILTDEKFWERANSFFLFKNTENKYFTLEEYETLIKENQTDKDKKLVYLYANDVDSQYTFIEAAKAKGYDVLFMDGQLDSHFISFFERKFAEKHFARVDSDVVEKLINKDSKLESKLTAEQQTALRPVFRSVTPEKNNFMVVFEPMNENEMPVMITFPEYLRRMKEMSKSGSFSGYYADLPDNYNLIINSNHPIIHQILQQKDESVGKDVSALEEKVSPLEVEKTSLESLHKDKKEAEIPQFEKDRLEELEGLIRELEDEKESVLANFGKSNHLVKQLIDLALLANNMLKGEDLTKFVKRSVELIK